MIDTMLLILVATGAVWILVVSLVLHVRAQRNVRTRARVGVRLHQIRRTRELTELRLAIRRDARLLRRAIDRDFDAVGDQ